MISETPATTDETAAAVVEPPPATPPPAAVEPPPPPAEPETQPTRAQDMTARQHKIRQAVNMLSTHSAAGIAGSTINSAINLLEEAYALG